MVVRFPAGVGRFAKIAAGRAHSLALTTDGVLWSWGSDRHGRLARPSTCGSQTGEVPGIVPDEVWGGGRVVDVACGYDHSLVVVMEKDAFLRRVRGEGRR